MASTSDTSGDQGRAIARVIEVAPARLPGWIDDFAARHGGLTHSDDDRAEAGDGSIARFERFDHDPLGVILVRRGGYAVGRVREGRLVAHKVGTRYVQSRTAAGGWSQQRFARRRGNQADELAGAVADHAWRILIDLAARDGDDTGEVPILDGRLRLGPGLLLGGDRLMVAQVLADRRLTSLRDLPTRTLYDLGDPNRAVLEAALLRGRAVRVTLTETTPS